MKTTNTVEMTKIAVIGSGYWGKNRQGVQVCEIVQRSPGAIRR